LYFSQQLYSQHIGLPAKDRDVFNKTRSIEQGILEDACKYHHTPAP